MSDQEKSKINNEEILNDETNIAPEAEDQLEDSGEDIEETVDNETDLPKADDDMQSADDELNDYDDENINNDTPDAYNEYYDEDSEDGAFEYAYEQEQTSNNQKTGSVFKVWLVTRFVKLRKIGKKKLTAISALFIALVVFAVLVFTDIIPILPNSFHRSYVGNKYELGETYGCVYEHFGKNVIYADNNRILCFGPDMSLKKEIEFFIDKPNIRVNGGGAIIYSPYERQAVVLTSDNKHNIIEFDEKLKRASVNSDGGYVLICRRAGFESQISAFDSNSELVYERNTNLEVTDAVLTDDNKLLCVATIESDKASLYSSLSFFDTTEQESVISEVTLEDNLVIELYASDSKIIAIGDNYTTCYNKSGVELWKISYDDKECNSYDICDEGEIIFLFNRFNSQQSESNVEIYNFNGKMIGDYQSDENIRALSANNSHCLLSTSKSTVLINSAGNVCKTKQIPFDFERVVLYENYNFGFAINDRVCKILSVNN